MATIRLLSLCCAMLATMAGVGAAADPFAALDAALARHAELSLAGLDFDRINRASDGAETRERCRGASERKAYCDLIEVDGAPPTAKQLKKYAKQQPQPVDSELPILKIYEWIDRAGVEVIESTSNRLRFSFRAAAENEDAYRKEGSMAGVLEIDREGGTLVRLTQDNSHKFSPATGVKVKKMSVEVEFDPTHALVTGLRLEVEGRALGLMPVKQVREYSFENFASAESAGRSPALEH